MKVKLERAREKDAAAIVAVRLAAARDLTARFSRGPWSDCADTVAGVELEVRSASVFVVRSGRSVIATLRLSEVSPWIGEVPFFSSSARPLYLTSMAVAPARQRQGVGRATLAAVLGVAATAGADAVRLDSFNLPGGAEGFYRRCGFTAVHRASYLGTPLIWFERRLERGSVAGRNLKHKTSAGRQRDSGRMPLFTDSP